MHSTNPPTDDEAVKRHRYDEVDLLKELPPHCGAGWRWTPFVLVILFSSYALLRFFVTMDGSLNVMQLIVVPLLMLMFAQLFILGKGLGSGGFVFALLRLFAALGFITFCLTVLTGVLLSARD